MFSAFGTTMVLDVSFFITMSISKKFVKNTSIKKPSSKLWLQRQWSDVYVKQAKHQGLRARSAFKLQQLNEKFRFLESASSVLDLGSAPGGWCQMVVQQTQHQTKKPLIVAVDLLDMSEILGVTFIQGDIFSPIIKEAIQTASPSYQVILSDLAPSSTGLSSLDHLRSMVLVEEVWELSKQFLDCGGTLVMKILQGGQETAFVSSLRPFFQKISYVKPEASRKHSTEIYLVAERFKK